MNRFPESLILVVKAATYRWEDRQPQAKQDGQAQGGARDGFAVKTDDQSDGEAYEHTAQCRAAERLDKPVEKKSIIDAVTMLNAGSGCTTASPAGKVLTALRTYGDILLLKAMKVGTQGHHERR